MRPTRSSIRLLAAALCVAISSPAALAEPSGSASIAGKAKAAPAPKAKAERKRFEFATPAATPAPAVKPTAEGAPATGVIEPKSDCHYSSKSKDA